MKPPSGRRYVRQDQHSRHHQHVHWANTTSNPLPEAQVCVFACRPIPVPLSSRKRMRCCLCAMYQEYHVNPNPTLSFKKKRRHDPDHAAAREPLRYTCCYCAFIAPILALLCCREKPERERDCKRLSHRGWHKGRRTKDPRTSPHGKKCPHKGCTVLEPRAPSLA